MPGIARKGFRNKYLGLLKVFYPYSKEHRIHTYPTGPSDQYKIQAIGYSSSAWVSGIPAPRCCSWSLPAALIVYPKMSFIQNGNLVNRIGARGDSCSGCDEWDEVCFGNIRQILIMHGNAVNSIQVVYDQDGTLVLSHRHGGDGDKFDSINLEPWESFTAISGHYGLIDDSHMTVVRSLTFGTNRATYGPYGKQEGAEFSFIFQSGCTFGGFYGCSDFDCLRAFGVYVRSEAAHHFKPDLARNNTQERKSQLMTPISDASNVIDLPKMAHEAFVRVMGRDGLGCTCYGRRSETLTTWYSPSGEGNGDNSSHEQLCEQQPQFVAKVLQMKTAFDEQGEQTWAQAQIEAERMEKHHRLQGVLPAGLSLQRCTDQLTNKEDEGDEEEDNERNDEEDDEEEDDERNDEEDDEEEDDERNDEEDDKGDKEENREEEDDDEGEEEDYWEDEEEGDEEEDNGTGEEEYEDEEDSDDED